MFSLTPFEQMAPASHDEAARQAFVSVLRKRVMADMAGELRAGEVDVADQHDRDPAGVGRAEHLDGLGDRLEHPRLERQFGSAPDRRVEPLVRHLVPDLVEGAFGRGDLGVDGDLRRGRGRIVGTQPVAAPIGMTVKTKRRE